MGRDTAGDRPGRHHRHCDARQGRRTIIVGRHTAIRLQGVHAPELSEPGGYEAQRFMAQLVAGERVECRLTSGWRSQWVSKKAVGEIGSISRAKENWVRKSQSSRLEDIAFQAAGSLDHEEIQPIPFPQRVSIERVPSQQATTDLGARIWTAPSRLSAGQCHSLNP